VHNYVTTTTATTIQKEREGKKKKRKRNQSVIEARAGFRGVAINRLLLLTRAFLSISLVLSL
jgi:hypothetical protein